MPSGTTRAMAFLRKGEDTDRKNARVIDKVLVALPRELNGEQRAALIRAFAERVTEGRASWLAAFHEGGKDIENPHVHLVIRDRDASGRRAARLSEKGSTERLRVLWEQEANAALAKARRPERIDRRTLKAQGVRRQPTIHEGVRSRRLDRKRLRPQSRVRTVRNAALARSPSREVDYRRLDAGSSRVVTNIGIRRANDERARTYWRELDGVTRERELERLRSIHLPGPGGRRDDPEREI